MTNIRDIIGDIGDKLTQDNIEVGDVYILALDESNGITPKNGETHATNSSWFLDLMKTGI